MENCLKLFCDAVSATSAFNLKLCHKNNLACEQCASGESETQCHALTCPGWEEHRAGLDLSSLEDMVTFFSRVLEDKEDRKKKEGGQS